MQLDRLTLQHFLTHDALVLPLDRAKIHVFIGPMGAGKTSLLDAIRWGLLGECRGLPKKDQGALIHEGAGAKQAALVTLSLRRGEQLIELSRKRTRTKEEIGVNGADPATLVESATGLSRQAMSWLLMPEQIWTQDPKKLEAALSDLLLKGHLGTWARQVLAAGSRSMPIGLTIPQGEDAAFDDLLRQADTQGFPLVHSQLVERRRGLKRQLEALPSPPAETLQVNGGAPIRLAEVDLAQAKARLTTLGQQQQALVPLAEAKARRDIVRSQWAQAEDEVSRLRQAESGLPLDILAEQVDQATRALQRAEHPVTGQRTRLATMQGQLAAARATLDRPPVPCPELVCPLRNEQTTLARQQFDTLDQLVRAEAQGLHELEATLPPLRAAQQTAEQAHSQAQQRQPILEAAQTRRDALAKELKRLEPVAVPEDLAATSADLQQRLRTGYEVVKAVEAYQVAVKQAAQREPLLDELATVEAFCTLFDPAGPLVGALKVAALDTWRTRMASHAQALGVTVTLDEDGEWRVNGRPRALLSGGEQRLLTILWQEALAHATGARFLMLDEVTLLDEGTRSRLMRWLYGLVRSDYDQIIVCAAQQGPLKPSPVAGIQIWEVTGGGVTPVVAPGADGV